MPRNATLDQRIAWHVAHATHCGCRPIDGKLAEEMKRRGMAIPVLRGSRRLKREPQDPCPQA